MSKHWPLGAGSYAKALAHSCLALTTAAFFLCYAEYMVYYSPAADQGLGEVAGVASAALFAMLALQGARLALFRPGVLAGLLPTPATEGGIYHILDPLRRLPYRALPYVLGILAMLPFQKRGDLSDALAIVSGCLFLRLLLPLLALTAVLLRKLLVPFGHWGMWLVAGATMIGAFHEQPVAGESLVRALVWFSHWSWQGYIVAGVASAALAYPVTLWCRAAAERFFRRGELRALAFPMHAERTAKPRKTVVEALGGSKRLRHFAFLLQEATGLYRPMDWAKAALLWLAVLLWALSLSVKGSGAGAHILVTLAPMAALIAWALARHVRLYRWQSVWVFGAYGLPVGQIELFWARTFALSAFYFPAGILGAVGIMALWPTAGTEASGFALTAAMNLAQVWLVVMAAGALFSTCLTSVSSKKAVVASILAFALLYGFMAASVAGALRTSGPGHQVVGSFLGNALHMAYAFVYAACTYTSFPIFMFSQDESPLSAIEAWRFEAVAWLLLAIVVWLSLRAFLSAARGRAHFHYRARVPAGPPMPFL